MASATLIHDAISKGIERAADAGFTKTYDIALFVVVDLNKAGLKVVRKPRKDGLIADLYKVKRVGNDNVTVSRCDHCGAVDVSGEPSCDNCGK
jgi:hypothetical protein